MLLIARRRWLMGGTRYNARGLDVDGNVANHTEVEQLVFHHSAKTPPEDTASPNSKILATTKVYSHVQVRGSIPIFWEQTGLTSVNVTKTDEVSAIAMLKHYTSLQKDYLGGPIAVVNLIRSHKGLERTLFERQHAVMAETNLLGGQEIDYYHFDFHTECKENSDPMLEFLRVRVLPNHMERIGLFVMRNDIVEEVAQDGNLKTRKLV